MPCTNVDPCNNCNVCTPDYTDLGCPDYPKSGCIIYDGDDIPCLSIVKTENLNEILEHLKDVICTLSPTSYEDFNYDCFSAVGITTEQEFVEFISSLLCEVIGAQVPGGITSLSTLNTAIQNNAININLVANSTVISCFQTLTGLSSTENIGTLLLAVQTLICSLNTRVTALEISGGLDLTAADSQTIDFTTSGTLNHTLTGSVKRSATANNAITEQADGLHVLSPVITPIDTNEINLTVSGTHSHNLQANIKLSSLTFANILTIEADGLLARQINIDAQDSTTIDFTNIGTTSFTGSVKIDPNVSNVLIATGSGLFVDGSSFTLGNNSVTNSILRDSSAYSIIGRTSGTVGDPADIIAGSDTVLRRSGSGNLDFGTIVTNNIGADQVTFDKVQNISSSRLLGRTSGGSGDIEQITVGVGLTLASGSLTADLTSLITESSYTPTLYNSTNVAASTAYLTYYQQIGETVRVWGELDIDATSASVLSELTMSLPISSTFSASYELAGMATFEDNTIVRISGSIVSDVAIFKFIPQTNTNNKYSFNFTYKIIYP